MATNPLDNFAQAMRTDPALRQAIMRFGLGLTQPIPPGGNAVSQIGGALTGSLDYLGLEKLRQLREEEDKRRFEAQQKIEQQKVDLAAAAEQARRGEQQQQVGLKKQELRQEKERNLLNYQAKIQASLRTALSSGLKLDQWHLEENRKIDADPVLSDEQKAQMKGETAALVQQYSRQFNMGQQQPAQARPVQPKTGEEYWAALDQANQGALVPGTPAFDEGLATVQKVFPDFNRARAVEAKRAMGAGEPLPVVQPPQDEVTKTASEVLPKVNPQLPLRAQDVAPAQYPEYIKAAVATYHDLGNRQRMLAGKPGGLNTEEQRQVAQMQAAQLHIYRQLKALAAESQLYATQ